MAGIRNLLRCASCMGPQDPYLSGVGTTGKLTWPLLSMVRTAKKTLSFERLMVTRSTLPALSTFSQSQEVVGRQSTSYPLIVDEAGVSQVNVLSFSNCFVSNFTFVGCAG